MNQATGTFVVKLTPQEDGDNGGLGRMRIDKLWLSTNHSVRVLV